MNEQLIEAAVQLIARAAFLPENGHLYPHDLSNAARVLLGNELYEAADARISEMVRKAGAPT